MLKQFNITKQDGNIVSANMTPYGDQWLFRFLSRYAQTNNLLEEFIIPDEIIRFNENISVFVDTVLQYIEQSDMFNDNELGVDGGYTIRDAVVTSKFTPTDTRDKLKYTKRLSGHLLDMSDWVVEVVGGALPYGLDLKYVDGDYLIEGNVENTDADDYLTKSNFDAQSGFAGELEKYKLRQIQFINVDYVDELNSNSIITPSHTLEIGDSVNFPVSGDTRTVLELDSENNFVVDEFLGNDIPLDYEYGRWVIGEDSTSIDTLWYGYLTVPSKNIFLRYSRLRHKFSEDIKKDHVSSSTFTLGIRRKTGTDYYDLHTYSLNIRSNLDKTRDSQLVSQEDSSKIYTDRDYIDVKDQNTEVYWSGSTFKDPLPLVIKFIKADGVRDDIDIVNEEFNFPGDPDNKVPVINKEVTFYKSVDGIRYQANIGVDKFA